MKKLIFAFLLTLCIVGCQSTSVFVWTIGDVFGLAFLGIAILVILFLFARAAVLDFFKGRKRKRFNKKFNNQKDEFNKKAR